MPESLKASGAARDWAEPLINQLCAFPEVRHDDLVDAMTQALRLLRDQGFLVVDQIVDNSDIYVDETRPRRVNPYAI